MHYKIKPTDKQIQKGVETYCKVYEVLLQYSPKEKKDMIKSLKKGNLKVHPIAIAAAIIEAVNTDDKDPKYVLSNLMEKGKEDQEGARFH